MFTNYGFEIIFDLDDNPLSFECIIHSDDQGLLDHKWPVLEGNWFDKTDGYCDIVDCSDYGTDGCTACLQDEFLIVDQTEYTPMRIYTPKAYYYQDGECLTDCSQVTGANLVNGDGECECADGYQWEDDCHNSWCISCREYYPGCNTCDFTGETCTDCISEREMVAPD